LMIEIVGWSDWSSARRGHVHLKVASELMIEIDSTIPLRSFAQGEPACRQTSCAGGVPFRLRCGLEWIALGLARPSVGPSSAACLTSGRA
jgi:hypothetical protein